jgi:hypothetical protein
MTAASVRDVVGTQISRYTDAKLIETQLRLRTKGRANASVRQNISKTSMDDQERGFNMMPTEPNNTSTRNARKRLNHSDLSAIQK